ncbi:hypothetical protein COU56_03555 [Candidatus Pacearchaeota archaeon CG10_big_fil_rev_8_21_14_0_10_31_9]|nr:MAG: hypothetical protein COU56_03555 [Candidatus Pacearchaeota archaeon CG10_big_fil_rev_8_21_14_0_10_31_9]PIZ82950.1 MAG: hypothetical protein COX97_02220 [Candidatus Pacearchaeota archaeon CG_4_10_14_0_2_um_filter_05_32_18]
MAENQSPKNLNEQINSQKYISKDQAGMAQLSEQDVKKMDAQKKELEKIKNWITKKFPFTIALGILPPEYVQKIEEEEDIPEEERKEKRIHIVHIIPEEEFKNIPKIKKEILEYTKDSKPKLWFHIITPVDIWNFYMDSRHYLTAPIAMAFPLYDTGLLGALRVAEIHKNMVIRKFEKYVSSYVIAGSLVRGSATKTSDVDVFIIIDDTDVKRMPRLELRERLRGIIYQYIAEATAIAGANNKLEPQIYLLTDFWEAVKDAHPVMFTFIRDGVPLYDRGTFIPWKLLLKMGKIKPSPESIDMFMSMGDKTEKTVERRLIDCMIDIFWGVITPSQALLMLYGIPPPTPKETTKLFKEVFHDKEKLIEKKYIDTLEKAVRLFKDYEHGKLNKIKGDEIDRLMKESGDYIKRLKQLREQIEKSVDKKKVESLEKEVFHLLEHLFGKKAHKDLVLIFEKEFIKKGKLPQKMLTVLKDIEKVTHEFKKGKVKTNDVENARKDGAILINHLTDYAQRIDLVNLEKTRMKISFKDQQAELILTEKGVFLLQGIDVRKITNRLEKSNIQEFNEAISNQKPQNHLKVDPKIFSILEKELGKFEIIL